MCKQENATFYKELLHFFIVLFNISAQKNTSRSFYPSVGVLLLYLINFIFLLINALLKILHIRCHSSDFYPLIQQFIPCLCVNLLFKLFRHLSF